ncbi:MAG: tRNA (guanosine(46)-N7)-methyltransferase TrmB [Myxococcales bacterium]|nr:tRNA (guanosine(46)-N7)-methyltransferase TrmB [Myxococcales bacterium]
MPMRLRQHVNPLHAHFAEFRGQLPVLDAGRPIELEIGCAEAQFLFERARRDPDRQYVGLEIREELVHWVNRHAQAARLPLTAVFCQAQLHLPLVMAGHFADRVYLNFPDPWFKRKHHNRRMIDEQLAVAIAEVTRPGAEIFVQSDVWEVALDALEVFERQSERFVNLAGEWAFWRQGNPFGARSWREQNAEDTGLPIWRILYHRR